MNGKHIAIAAALFLLVGGGAGAIMTTGQKRGIRNNNPGNIRKSSTKWQGLAAKQTDPAFFVFSAPEYGLRAIGRILQTYQSAHGLRTIRGVITRWAPPSENNTAAYIKDVSDRVGASPDAPLDFRKKSVQVAMMAAITMHEEGRQPYTPELLALAADMAGAVA